MMVMMMMMMISSSSSSSSKDQHNSTQNVAFSFYPSRNKGGEKTNLGWNQWKGELKIYILK